MATKFVVTPEDWLSIALWRIGHPRGGADPRINLQAVADRFDRTPALIRRWYKNGIDGLPYETAKRIAEIGDVDIHLLVERGRYALPTAFADGTTCGTSALEAAKRPGRQNRIAPPRMNKKARRRG
jgi:hypothetical protein